MVCLIPVKVEARGSHEKSLIRRTVSRLDLDKQSKLSPVLVAIQIPDPIGRCEGPT